MYIDILYIYIFTYVYIYIYFFVYFTHSQVDLVSRVLVSFVYKTYTRRFTTIDPIYIYIFIYLCIYIYMYIYIYFFS